MADNPPPDRAALRSRGLPPPGTPTEQRCAYRRCNRPIHIAQHYVRAAVLFDTAGLEAAHLLNLPDGLAWSDIFDTPACAGLALIEAATTDPIFLDVFNR